MSQQCPNERRWVGHPFRPALGRGLFPADGFARKSRARPHRHDHNSHPVSTGMAMAATPGRSGDRRGRSFQRTRCPSPTRRPNQSGNDLRATGGLRSRQAGNLLGLPRQTTAQTSGNSCCNPSRFRGTTSRGDMNAASVGHHLVVYADNTATYRACSDDLSLTLPTEIAANAGILQEPLSTILGDVSRYVVGWKLCTNEGRKLHQHADAAELRP